MEQADNIAVWFIGTLVTLTIPALFWALIASYKERIAAQDAQLEKLAPAVEKLTETVREQTLAIRYGPMPAGPPGKP